MFPPSLQALALIILAWPFGMQLHPLQMVFGPAVLALFGAGVAALSYALAIAARHNTSLFYMVSQSVALPLMLLGGVLLPIENGPGWLYVAEPVQSADLSRGSGARAVRGRVLLADGAVGCGRRWWLSP